MVFGWHACFVFLLLDFPLGDALPLQQKISRFIEASLPGFKDVGCDIDDSTTANRAMVGGVLHWFTREPCNARANKRHSSGLTWVSRWV